MNKAQQVIKEIIGRGVEYFDYKSRDKSFWRNYFTDAQNIVNSDVFQNEMNHHITDLMKFITYEADTLDKVLHTRTAIVTLEAFRERLLSVEDPNEMKGEVNPYEAI